MIKEKILKKLIGYDIKKISINSDAVKLQIQLGEHDNAEIEEKKIRNLLEDMNVYITFFKKDQTKQPFKKVIGISSGKGGVGKSTIALNIAFALKEKGYKVGILDADIYAPSMPVLLNVSEHPTSLDGRLIEPIKTPHGFQLLSMGLFLQENQSALWRGPMLASAFTQFLEQSNWDCEYLVIDLPPGTSDIHMACSKIASFSEFFLISTPSKLAYTDAYRMYAVLRALNLKVVGLIENLAYTKCRNCSHEEHFESKAQIKEIEKIIKLPMFHHFHKFDEDGYPSDYKQQEEASYFQEIIARILNE